MPDKRAYIDDITHQFRDVYVKRNVLMTFQEYVDLVSHNPRKFIRNSAQYLLDAFAYFETETVTSLFHPEQVRFKMFNIGTERAGPIIGGEQFQNEFYYILKNFARNGFNSLLTLFHGPNGSAKSSTVETIANAMEAYSKTEEGAIYRFNWIFPTDKDSYPALDSQAIGFGKDRETYTGKHSSFALLEDGKIAAKLSSEFKENPLFLLPMPFREHKLKTWLRERDKSDTRDVSLPPHILTNGLSKKNQEIFEHLLNSYHGDLGKVFRHVQIERFYYSKQYRVGISTVEPQMSIDAFEKQVTLDKNYVNLPSLLQAINFHQYLGPIVEANRGLLEFSDLLKRPIETFKYLISAIEKSSINLPSGTAGLDIIFVATTNDKHLDAFKSIPDFSSFKGRFELVTVPYLLLPKQEELIFKRDVELIRKIKPICPHAINTLCTWGVLTRLKQPDPEKYAPKYRTLITRLDPFSKLNLYQNEALSSNFTRQEQGLLKEVRDKIISESQGTLIYEGRFGASPRELKAILHRAAHNSNYSDLTPMSIFEEIENLMKDISVYEFLQFESRGNFHNNNYFLEKLKENFTRTFENEVIQSMSMVGEKEYSSLLERYVMNVVAFLKNEKIWDEVSRTHITPSEKLMNDIESVLPLSASVGEHRNNLLSRIAAFRIENPKKDVVVSELFHDYLVAIKEHSYNEKRKVIDQNFKTMLALERGESVDKEKEDLALLTYKNMEEKFGYSRRATYDCMVFIFKQKTTQKES